MTDVATKRPTGRPYITAYDHVAKNCLQCGAEFRLRDRKFQSLGRFQKRQFCSPKCARDALVGGNSSEPAEARFWRLVTKGAGCWNWTGPITAKGYGSFNYQDRKLRAHRYSYELAKGAIPDGLMILHSCDNRLCVNPDHLRAGTARENWQDAVDRHRVHYRMVDASDPRIWIGTVASAAKAMGVSQSTIWRYRNNQRGAA